MNYNSAFFGLFENVFLLLKDEFGEKKALELFSALMSKGLSKSYGNNFTKGDSKAFEQLVKERDAFVGLKVDFPLVTENKLIYCFVSFR